MSEETKVCKRCGKEFKISEFGKNEAAKDGKQSWCNRCNRLYNSLRIEYADVGGVKVCSKCRRIKPLTDFYKIESRRDGCSSYCKDCDKEHGRMRNGTTGEYRIDTTLPPQQVIKRIATPVIVAELKDRGAKGSLEFVTKVDL